MTQPQLDIRPLAAIDCNEITKLHSSAFGPGRFARTAYRVREAAEYVGNHSSSCSRCGWIGDDLAAAVTMTPVTIGGTPGAMLLGPLVVAPTYAGQGYGEPMVNAALEAAKQDGQKLVVLVGDHAYYKRFGFETIQAGQITLPGPVDVQRLLAVELATHSLPDFSGLIAPR